MSSSRDRTVVLGDRQVSAPCRHVLTTRGESFAEPLANPLSKWLCLLKDAWFVTASHLPAPQCQSIRQGRQPWEIQSFLSALSFARGIFKASEATRDSARTCCPTFASGFCPQEDFVARELLKVVSYWRPRRAIRDNVCAATRMAQSERSRPSQDGASPRGLQDAFKHADPTDDLWSRRATFAPA